MPWSLEISRQRASVRSWAIWTAIDCLVGDVFKDMDSFTAALDTMTGTSP